IFDASNSLRCYSSGMRDDILRLVLHCGGGAKCYYNGDYWSLSLLREPQVRITVVEKTFYHGPTWCVTVPSGLIITRRRLNDNCVSTPFVTGNCTAPMPFFVGVLKSCLPLLETMPLEEVLVLDVENDK